MGLSTAERNRRKRERKKKEREQRKKEEEQQKEQEPVANEDVEIEYVAEPIVPEFEALRRFQERASAVVSDDERNALRNDATVGGDDVDEDEDGAHMSKRKIREMLRPSVADLKRNVPRPDLVEAHDVTANDPEFLINMKAVPGTVPVPRHWGRKRKYLQGKVGSVGMRFSRLLVEGDSPCISQRGFEKPPFQLPDFIVKTGITAVRDTVAEQEAGMSAKQKNRSRVAPKMGAIDVDYKTLHDAFFKHQTKPAGLTKFGDLYYEGKELEVKTDMRPGGPLSKDLREALGMTSETSPPPWLVNMQRYGPPPSYPGLKIPGLNAPLPTPECQYGYHPGGWGKPPIDAYGRPLYGGNPFDPPGSNKESEDDVNGMVTSDGKTILKSSWGALPVGDMGEDESEEEESSDSEMEESEGEEEESSAVPGDGAESVLPPPSGVPLATAPMDLRKQAGDETPVPGTKQLYQVIEQKAAASDEQSGTVFASEVAYVIPGQAQAAAAVPEGAESVLSKVPQKGKAKRKSDDNDDDEDDLGKSFKF